MDLDLTVKIRKVYMSRFVNRFFVGQNALFIIAIDDEVTSEPVGLLFKNKRGNPDISGTLFGTKKSLSWM